jgi:hypothetical protein
VKHGYMAYAFEIHEYGAKKNPLKLGDLGGGGRPDAITLLYGALCGLRRDPFDDDERHLGVIAVEGIGRSVRFCVELGRSGIDSKLYQQGSRTVEFTRTRDHIESGERRGLFVAPFQATKGLLVVEMEGRSGPKVILTKALKRIIRDNTGLIVDFFPLVDEDALEQYLNKAAVKAVTLRRSGMPRDIADAVEYSDFSQSAGTLEMRIIPDSRVGHFAKSVMAKLRGDEKTRRRLLQFNGIDFSELSFALEDGQRTLTVTADRIPSFVYELSGRGRPDDRTFYAEISSGVQDMASALGIPVGTSWQSGVWSQEAQSTILLAPWRGDGDHGSTE